MTTKEWTLLYNTEAGMSELYNIKDDPKQENNLISKNPEQARDLHKLLVRYMKDTNLANRLLPPRLELRF